MILFKETEDVTFHLNSKQVAKLWQRSGRGQLPDLVPELVEQNTVFCCYPEQQFQVIAYLFHKASISENNFSHYWLQVLDSMNIFLSLSQQIKIQVWNSQV